MFLLFHCGFFFPSEFRAPVRSRQALGDADLAGLAVLQIALCLPKGFSREQRSLNPPNRQERAR